MIVHMMQNMDLPVSPEQWPTVTEYLIKGFPEKPKPAAVVVPGPVEAAITEWPVPTLASRPHDPFASIERRNLVHGTNCEPPWKAITEDRSVQRISSEDPAHGAAWPDRRRAWEYLVYRQQCRAYRQARSEYGRRYRIPPARPRGA